jgi:hypothetical protein
MMLHEFYINNFLRYHIGLVDTIGGKGILTNIPSEILWRNAKEFRQLSFMVQAMNMTEYQHVVQASKIIEKDPLSKWFYYPDYPLFSIFEKQSEFIQNYLNHEIPPEFDLKQLSHYSHAKNMRDFYTITQRVFINKFFYHSHFQDVFFTSTREEFQINLPNEEAVNEYIDLMSPNNLFMRFFYEDKGVMLYFLFQSDKLQMVTTGNRL